MHATIIALIVATVGITFASLVCWIVAIQAHRHHDTREDTWFLRAVLLTLIALVLWVPAGIVIG